MKMIRRLRRGSKRSATRDGYNDVNDQGSQQDDNIFIDAAHKQLNSHSPNPASPSRSSSYPQKNKTKQTFDSPDDVSKGFTSLTYESSLTGESNASKSRNGDNSVSFSTIWEREENDVEPYVVNANSTPMKIAAARRSALNIARHDKTSNKMHINSRRHSESKLRSTVLVANSDNMRNTEYNAAQISRSRRESSPHFDNDHRKDPSQQWKTSSSVASSAQTPKQNNESRHMISRLLKTHQSESRRSNDSNKYAASMEPSKRELAPTISVKRNNQTSSRKTSGERPDPTSKSSEVAKRLDRAPDPPAEDWKRPIPVKHVASSYTKHTASSSKFWDEVEKFPAVKGDRELQQFFRQHLVRVKKEAVILDMPRKTSGIQVLETNQRNDTPQDDTDNFSNAFSLNLAMDKHGHFDDSDISMLEMFDSATVYHQNALAAESGDKNYWKLKYDRLKQETRAALKEEKIVEEPVEDEEEESGQQNEPKQKPKPKAKVKPKTKPKAKVKPKEDNDIDGLFSGLTDDLDDGDASPFCRNELKQTMNVLMQKVNEIEKSGKVQLDQRIEDNPCIEMAEQVIFPVNPPQKKPLADDLTAGASSHLIESESAKAQRFTPICTISETEIISDNEEKKDIKKSLPSDDDQLQAKGANIITPEKQDITPTERRPQSEMKYEFAHPMICLGSLQAEATSSTRVKNSFLRCSDSLISRFLSNSNQLANPYGVDPQNIIRLCQNPQMARKSISQTIVNYGKKVLKKREVISELNHNILRFGGRHPLVGESHLKVGIVHMFDGHYADSVLHLEEAIKIKTHLESEHQDIPSIIMFIALDQLALERFDDCMASLLAVRQLREDAIGKTHPEIGSILNNIACLCYELGNSIKAEKLFQEALDLQRASFTTDPTFLNSVSTLLSNIAFLHAKNGLFSKALIELEGALQIQQEILCDEGSESEAILENIAHIMAIQKMQHGSGNMEEITNQYMAMLKRH